MSHLILLPVYLWRSTAILRAPRCRFHPTCSTYAVQAVRGHGIWRGSVLAARRVGRCHPWNPGGFDRVPDGADRTAWRRRWTGPGPRPI
ncbi:MAG: membrane protein insertion efficiency factor YidD [Nitriliruptoraceae bacterium]